SIALPNRSLKVIGIVSKSHIVTGLREKLYHFLRLAARIVFRARVQVCDDRGFGCSVVKLTKRIQLVKGRIATLLGVLRFGISGLVLRGCAVQIVVKRSAKLDQILIRLILPACIPELIDFLYLVFVEF